MRQIFILLAVLLLSQFVAADIDSNLMAFWRLDDGSGTIAQDSTGNNKDLNLINTPTWINGYSNGGLHFTSASSEYAKTDGNINSSGTSAVSISWWMSTVFDNVGHFIFEDSYNTNLITTGWTIYTGTTGDAPNNIMVSMKGNIGYNQKTYAYPSNSTWHHFVAVLNKSAAGASEVTF